MKAQVVRCCRSNKKADYYRKQERNHGQQIGGVERQIKPRDQKSRCNNDCRNQNDPYRSPKIHMDDKSLDAQRQKCTTSSTGLKPKPQRQKPDFSQRSTMILFKFLSLTKLFLSRLLRILCCSRSFSINSFNLKIYRSSS